MLGLFEQFMGLFRSPPAPVDREKMDALWRDRRSGAVRRIGTVGELRRVIAAADLRGGNCGHALTVLAEFCRRQDERHGERLPSGCTQPHHDDVVGDPNDVHYIIPPMHGIGYAIEECEDGFALETIETLDMRWTVLRRRHEIIGVDRTIVLRQESYRGSHVL